jgi:hypothetical protein
VEPFQLVELTLSSGEFRSTIGTRPAGQGTFIL